MKHWPLYFLSLEEWKSGLNKQSGLPESTFPPPFFIFEETRTFQCSGGSARLSRSAPGKINVMHDVWAVSAKQSDLFSLRGKGFVFMTSCGPQTPASSEAPGVWETSSIQSNSVGGVAAHSVLLGDRCHMGGSLIHETSV